MSQSLSLSPIWSRKLKALLLSFTNLSQILHQISLSLSFNLACYYGITLHKLQLLSTKLNYSPSLSIYLYVYILNSRSSYCVDVRNGNTKTIVSHNVMTINKNSKSDVTLIWSILCSPMKDKKWKWKCIPIYV